MHQHRHRHRHGRLAQICAQEPVVALVGNPNVGKSAIFSALTGRYAVVSNYPGTTVEVTSGTARLAGERVEVIDAPGVNSLIPRSEDEQVARAILLDRNPRAVIQVIDAKNLRRGLQITSQLAEMGVPIVIALNLWDEAIDRGVAIDSDKLSRLLGVPVVRTVATQRIGIGALASAVALAAVPAVRVDYGPAMEAAIAAFPGTSRLPMGRRAAAIMLLAGDDDLEDRLAAGDRSDQSDQTDHSSGPQPKAHSPQLFFGWCRALQAQVGEPLSYAISKHRAAAVDAILAQVMSVHRPMQASQFTRRLFFCVIGPLLGVGVSYATAMLAVGAVGKFVPLGRAGTAATWAATALGGIAYIRHFLRNRSAPGGIALLLGNLSMHRALAFPILVAVLWLTYLVVGVIGAGTCVDFIESTIFGTTIEPSGGFSLLGLHVPFDGINWYLAGLAQRVISPESMTYQLLLSEDAGLIRVGMTYAIAIVLPIVGFFFLAFGLMEDSGYLPRLAVMVDWLFKQIGLNGKAVLPIVLGFGCDTMATLTTRILETKRERIIATLLLALAIPCSAQLGIISGVLADIGGGGAFAIYVAVIASQFLFIGYLASKVVKGKRSDFVLEIPSFRVPQLGNVLVKTAYRVWWFLKEAVPLFLAGTLALFIFTRIGYNEQHRPLGLLSYSDAIGAPVTVNLLGLPAKVAPPDDAGQTSQEPGARPEVRGSSTEAFILGFLRRDYGAVAIRENFKSGFFTARQAMVALVVITLFVPCLANLLVIIKERGALAASLIIGFIIPYAFLVGGVLNWILKTTGRM